MAEVEKLVGSESPLEVGKKINEIIGELYQLDKGLPVGTVFSHTCSASFVPENSLPCNGSEYTQAQFPNLYNDWLVGGKLKTCTYTEYSNMLTTYGQCPMWALDTTNKKFKVPTIKDGAVVQQAMSDSEIGKAYNAGLPNIEGTFIGGKTDSSATDTQEQTGVFKIDKTVATYQGGNGPMACYSFDASRSSSIYGNSNTVQMNAVTLRYFVVVATKTISQSAMDWSKWASNLNSKANTSDVLSKVNGKDCKAYITETYKSGAAWYRVYSDGWCEQGGGASGEGSALTVTFLKNYVDTNYGTSIQTVTTGTNTSQCETKATSMTESGFKITKSSSSNFGFKWMAWGYIN